MFRTLFQVYTPLGPGVLSVSTVPGLEDTIFTASTGPPSGK